MIGTKGHVIIAVDKSSGYVTPERVADEALRVLTDPAKAAAVKRDLRDVHTRLGTRGASRRAAQAVLDVARKT